MIYEIAQIFGFIGLIISIYVFQNNNRNKILNWGIVATLLYAIHFFC